MGYPLGPTLPPFIVQKKAKVGKTKLPQNFWIPVQPPPLLDNVQKKDSFLWLPLVTAQTLHRHGCDNFDLLQIIIKLSNQ